MDFHSRDDMRNAWAQPSLMGKRNISCVVSVGAEKGPPNLF